MKTNEAEKINETHSDTPVIEENKEIEHIYDNNDKINEKEVEKIDESYSDNLVIERECEINLNESESNDVGENSINSNETEISNNEMNYSASTNDNNSNQDEINSIQNISNEVNLINESQKINENEFVEFVKIKEENETNATEINSNNQINSSNFVHNQDTTNETNITTFIEDDSNDINLFAPNENETTTPNFAPNENETTTPTTPNFAPNENETTTTPNFAQNDGLQSTINDCITSNDAKRLMTYLNSICDNDLTSQVFDRFYHESNEFYLSLCKEGISLNNAVAHHKYAISLIFDQKNEKDRNQHYKEARKHLKKSIHQGFYISYFTLSRLEYEIFNKPNSAFKYAKEGTMKNEKYSKCLYGFFIAHGIGTRKDFKRGLSIILSSGAENYYQKFATDIGIYYYYHHHSLSNESEAFNWFEKAFIMNKTKASINNYGVCLMKGIGVDKNIEKAKEIFEIGIEKNDPISMYHIAFILEKTDPNNSFKYYKKSAELGFVHAQKKYAFLMSKINQKESIEFYKKASDQGDSEASLSLGKILKDEDMNSSISYYKKAAENGNVEAIEFLVKFFMNENDQENVHNYVSSLIKLGQYQVPIDHAIFLYKSEKFKQSFDYFSVISKFNHPIAKFFIGLMKFRGNGCTQNKEESYQIMKSLSEQGIEEATEFLENYFDE